MNDKALPTDLFGHVLECLDLGVALLDAEARVAYANTRLCDWFSQEKRDPVGVPLLEAFPALVLDFDWQTAVRMAFDRNRTVRLVRQPLLPGEHFDLSLSAVRGCDAGNKRALLTVRDVSEAVRMQTRHLSQARSQAIANLGDSVAHEIRNPLNSIHMNVQLLREGIQNPEPDRKDLDRTARIIQNEIKRLDRVVRDFVRYSRPPALNLRPGSLNRIARNALDALDGEIREKKLRIVQDLQSARAVAMDADRLQRAIYNVLLNAVQVLGAGGTITCRSRDEVSHALLEISDDGPGIDLLKQQHLFDLFYTTKDGGTGLGLPIANRIVEEHGGQIAVASEPGQGTSFAFFLPYEGGHSAPEGGPTAVPVHPESR